MTRTLETTGRLFIVLQAWREWERDSPLPSVGQLREAKTDGTPDGDIALIYCDRVVYVERAYCREVTHVATR
jgi:hypothetical protein